MARPPAGSIWPASSTRWSAWWWRRGGSPASTRCATRTSWPGWTRRPRSAADRRRCRSANAMWLFLTANFRELCKGEVRRIPLPRRSVNTGRGCLRPVIFESSQGPLGLLAKLRLNDSRLITPGQTFLTPPSGLNPPWRQAMSFLTYSADLILGAIAGLVVLGVGGIDTSDPVKLIGTCVVAGVGGSGFLTNLGSKAQAGTDQATATAQLDQQTNRLQQAHNAAGDARQKVQDGLEQGSVPPQIANQLSNNLASIQAVAQASPEVPPA